MRLSRVAATFLVAALSAHAQLVPLDPLWQEADELIAIFVTMAKNTKDRKSEV